MAVHTADLSYHDLQRGLLVRALVPFVVTGWVLMLLDNEIPTLVPFFLGIAMLTVAGMAFTLSEKHRRAATWLLCLGQMALIALARSVYPDISLGYLFIFPGMLGAICLGPFAAILLASLSSLAFYPGLPNIGSGIMGSDNWINLGAVWSITYLAITVERAQKEAIMRGWRNYDDAQRHLDLARSRQVELKQALADLAQATQETIRLNEMLNAAREAVEYARRSKEAFAANVSHELRTPLNMIIGFSDLILQTPQAYAQVLPPALLADVAAIKRNSEHLSHLVDDVLSLAEADAGEAKLSVEATRVDQLIHEAVQAVQVLFEQKGLYLDIQAAPDLPALYCDRTRIRQVILNLLGNAGRFTEKGGATVTARLDEGVMHLSVSDTGPGIERETQRHIFEPFWQGDPSIRRRYGGTGLGLAISKRFVEMHGGRIWIETEAGKGTSIHFTLPIVSPLAVLDGAQRWFNPYTQYDARTRRSLAPQVAGRRGLVVVEQEQRLGTVIGQTWRDSQIVSVPTIEEALELINGQGAIALVVNSGSGWETAAPDQNAIGPMSPLTLAQRQSLSFDIPVFACSLPERHAALARLGAQDYLTKPISRECLQETVARYVPASGVILVADDDVEARQLFGRMLVSMGNDYIVLDAEDGQETLEVMLDRLPDLVLLDLVMPRKTGYSVLQERAQDERIRDIPVVIISAKDMEEEPVLCPGLTVTRPEGLPLRDLALTIQAVSGALQPRFARLAQPQNPDAP